MWPSEEACCEVSFQGPCAKLPAQPEACWVVDTYFPARLCRNSTTLCSNAAKGEASSL